MGSYAQILIGQYPISSTKNYYYEWFFRKKDRIIRSRTKAERNTMVWVAASPEEMEEIETDYLYLCSGTILRRRLALAGFNRETLEREFKECIAERIANREDLCQQNEEWKKRYTDSLPILKASTLTDWLTSLKKTVDEQLRSRRWDDVKDTYNDPVLHLLLNHDEFADETSIHETGFPCKTLESMAVAMLEIMPSDVECIQDITDLINGGWTDDFEDIIEYHQDHTTFYEVFTTAIEDTRSLIPLAPENKTLAKLLFANVITAMETYLSDTLKKQVFTRDAIRRRFVQTSESFRDKKFTIQDIFQKMESLNEEIVKVIDATSFHNLDKTTGLYKAVLDTDFLPEYMAELKKAIEARHDIVHRNGKTTQGKAIHVTMPDIERLMVIVNETILHIDKQIKDGLLDDDGNQDEVTSETQ